MRFWDTSAVVPLLVEQAASPKVGEWRSADAGMVLWALTSVEVISAVQRLVRERLLEDPVARAAGARLGDLLAASHIVADVEAVKMSASRLLRLHALRAFDALQLGAAVHWAQGRPQGRVFHTLDLRLAEAAQLEGFVVPA